MKRSRTDVKSNEIGNGGHLSWLACQLKINKWSGKRQQLEGKSKFIRQIIDGRPDEKIANWPPRHVAWPAVLLLDFRLVHDMLQSDWLIDRKQPSLT